MKEVLDESRVYMENGVVKVRHIMHKPGEVIDMTPHPTESRIFVKDGDVVEVLSQKIEDEDAISVEESQAIISEALRKGYQLEGKL